MAAYLEKVAKAEGMAFSACCAKILHEAIGEMMETDSYTEGTTNEEPDETVHIRLHGKAGAMLKKKSSELGLTPTDWVRDTVLKKNLTIYQIEIDDLGVMNETLDRLVDAVEGICTAVLMNKKMYKQDLDLIQARLKDILDLFRLQFALTLDRRKKELKRLEKKNNL